MDAAHRQQPFHLLHAEDLRPMHRLVDRRQAPPQLLHRALQHQLIKRTQRVDRQVERSWPPASLLRQVEQVVLELLITELVRGLVIMLGQP